MQPEHIPEVRSAGGTSRLLAGRGAAGLSDRRDLVIVDLEVRCRGTHTHELARDLLGQVGPR